MSIVLDLFAAAGFPNMFVAFATDGTPLLVGAAFGSF